MPSSYGITFTPARADLHAFGRDAIPRFLRDGRSEEDLYGLSRIMFTVLQVFEDWHRMTFLEHADGRWLVAHAADRGTSLMDGETPEQLRARLYRYDDVVTRPALLAHVQSILETFGVAGTAVMIELRRDRGWLRDKASNGRRHAYASRGYRCGSTRPSTIIVILPAGTSEACRLAVLEGVRQRKAGGFKHMVEAP